jgi:isopenicillin N synthase-like dioxygenase
MAEPKTTQLRLASGQGPVTRTVLQTPPRDALQSEIPVIDISAIFSASLHDRQAVARQIRDAATNIGFFYISNHGVSEPVIENMYKTSLSFFRQDLQTKLNVNSTWSQGQNSGYRPSASQRVNPDEGADNKESFTWAYDPEYDPDIGDHVRAHMPSNPSLWEMTSHQPQFKPALVAYLQACLTLARALTKSFALSLDLPEDHFDPKIKHPDAMTLLNYYPEKEPRLPTERLTHVSLGSHTDFRLFTILWQDSTGGLQILNREGQWINAAPVPGTFVVNIADFMQRITNDRYVSTVHRAHNWSGKERVSVPFFWGFGSHETCGVLDGCVADGEEKRYDDISVREYVDSRLRQLYLWREELDGAEGV